MLDLKYLCQNKEFVSRKLQTRGMNPSIVEEIFNLNESRRRLIAEGDALKEKRNAVSAEVAKLKKGGKEATDKITAMKDVGDRIKKIDNNVQIIDEKLQASLLTIPNLPHDSVPVGKDSSHNKEIRRGGVIPKFDFKAKNHWDIGEELGILDFETAAKITGARFALYRGAGAFLERALINFMLDINRKNGYEEILPPFIINRQALIGTGQLPKFEQDQFKLVDLDYFLVPTAEVPLTNIHREEILNKEDLPRYYTAYTPCFRKEAGSYGQDTKGLIRQHQFNKVEIVKIVEPSSSYDELETMVRHAEEILQRLEIPYRIMVLSTGDMGFSAAKCYDIEVWIPGQNMYREISSCSNCEDFQARRANIRYRPGSKEKPVFVHTLNGSALAVGRTVVALLENFQQKDGSVLIPKSLQPYMGGMEKIEREKRRGG